MYEIKREGQLDVYGVKRARKEQLLKNFQIFFDCILFGFTMDFLLTGGLQAFQDNPYANFWIMFDSFVTISILGYVYVSQLMMIKGEVTKNLYTLSYLQRLRSVNSTTSTDVNDNLKWNIHKLYLIKEEEQPHSIHSGGSDSSDDRDKPKIRGQKTSLKIQGSPSKAMDLWVQTI